MGKINCAILLFLAAYPLCAQTEAPSQAIESARESLAGRIELMKSKEAFEAEKDALESAVKALEERNSAVKAKTAELQKNAENIRAQAKSLTGERSASFPLLFCRLGFLSDRKKMESAAGSDKICAPSLLY